MSRKLAATVHVDGKVYKAGETVDADVAKQITNPKAWEQSDAKAAESDDDSTDAEGDKPAARGRRRNSDS